MRKPPACGADRKPSESLVGWCSSQEAGSTFKKERERGPLGGALCLGGGQEGAGDPCRVAGGGRGQKGDQEPHRLMLECS